MVSEKIARRVGLSHKCLSTSPQQTMADNY
jgi:hypothetical protein